MRQCFPYWHRTVCLGMVFSALIVDTYLFRKGRIRILAGIKYLVLDIDGTLTDGKIYMGNDREVMKAFSIKDGYAINYILKPERIECIVITGRTSKIVENRCKELGITRVCQGVADKLSVLREMIGSENLGMCAYFGDDILDLACMNPIKAAGGVAGCPADAVAEVKSAADYLCMNSAGEGALREFAEWLVTPGHNRWEIERKVQFAIAYLKKLDLGQIGSGIQEVNEDFYYFVQEYKTKKPQDCVLESHRKYIDIQWIVEGEEAIDVVDVSRLQIEQKYSVEKDILLWKPVSNRMRVVLKAGSYVVLYPEDAHMGCIAVDGQTQVKKIIGKIRI